MRQSAIPLLLLLSCAATAQDKATYTITIKAGPHERRNTPVVVPLSVPKALAEVSDASLTSGKKEKVVEGGQLTAPALTTESIKARKEGEVRRDLHLIVKHLPAGETLEVECVLDKGSASVTPFQWKHEKDAFTDLVNRLDTAKPMLRYMHSPYDDSSVDKRNKTFKVFHHLYDRDNGRQLTNGGQTDVLPQGAKLQYPHHRGLFFGFNKVSWDKGAKKADVWHCQKDDHISHEKFLSEEVGNTLGRHRLLLHWHGPQKEVFAHEQREVTVYNLGGGTLVEWSTLVTTKAGPVKLDGDPQHAGFHFRAANEVASRGKETYFLRPDGKDKLGATRNWPGQKEHVNLPWSAMSFKLGDDRYTAAYLAHRSNPGETRHSERDYGRFGCYFEYDLTEEKPLRLNYRVWLQKGEMTGPQVEALHRDLTTPPIVEVK